MHEFLPEFHFFNFILFSSFFVNSFFLFFKYILQFCMFWFFCFNNCNYPLFFFSSCFSLFFFLVFSFHCHFFIFFPVVVLCCCCAKKKGFPSHQWMYFVVRPTMRNGDGNTQCFNADVKTTIITITTMNIMTTCMK